MERNIGLELNSPLDLEELPKKEDEKAVLVAIAEDYVDTVAEDADGKKAVVDFTNNVTDMYLEQRAGVQLRREKPLGQKVVLPYIPDVIDAKQYDEDKLGTMPEDVHYQEAIITFQIEMIRVLERVAFEKGNTVLVEAIRNFRRQNMEGYREWDSIPDIYR